MNPLTAILYRSEALTGEGSPEDRAILDISRRNNAARDITGFLYREDDVFYQWLEGPGQAVADTFAAIRSDPRHTGVRELSRHSISGRNFGMWTMGHTDRHAVSLFDWAAENGIALHAVSPGQILRFLTHCARRA